MNRQLLSAASPTAAQESEDGLMIVSGIFRFGEQNAIVVNGYTITPAGCIPANYEEGDWLTVIGYLLPDGKTIQPLRATLIQAWRIRRRRRCLCASIQ